MFSVLSLFSRVVAISIIVFYLTMEHSVVEVGCNIKSYQTKPVGYIIYRRFPSHREYLIYESTQKPHFWTLPTDDVRNDSYYYDLALESLEETVGLTPDDIEVVCFNGQRTFEPGTAPNYDVISVLIAKLMEPDKRIAMCNKYMRFKWMTFEYASPKANELSNRILTDGDAYLKQYNY